MEYQSRILVDKGYAGKWVTLGVRPQDLHEREKAGEEDQRNSPHGWIGIRVNVREMLGSEVLLHGITGQLESRPGQKESRPGQRQSRPGQWDRSAEQIGRTAVQGHMRSFQGMYTGGEDSSEKLAARMPASCQVKPGEFMKLYVDISQIKLLDMETEDNILFD